MIYDDYTVYLHLPQCRIPSIYYVYFYLRKVCFVNINLCCGYALICVRWLWHSQCYGNWRLPAALVYSGRWPWHTHTHTHTHIKHMHTHHISEHTHLHTHMKHIHTHHISQHKPTHSYTSALTYTYLYTYIH